MYEKMKKCCFVIPYFGKLPNYFQLFLNSCKYNQDYNWLLFTDDDIKYEYPVNVKKIKISFRDFRRYFQDKFDFKIELSRPYKLCDYKPAYGYVLQEYLRGYRFWGHCDIDLIFGSISNFITDEMLDNYDKLFCLGHFIMYRNTIENNKVFMSRVNGLKLFQKVFSTPNIMVFDEELRNSNNVNQIFLNEGKRVFVNDYSMNPYIFKKQFIRVRYVGCENGYSNAFVLEIPRKAVYLWQKGHVCRYFLEDNLLKEEEFLYIHLQKRQMKYNARIGNSDIVQILPNTFRALSEIPLGLDAFKKIKKEAFCLQKTRLTFNSFIKRIKNNLSRLFSYN